MSRKDAILRILDKEERPIRGRELYEKLLKEPEGWKHGIVGGEAFWYADFPSLMNALVSEGLVYKFKAGNKVFYYITEKGRSVVRPRDYQSYLKSHLRYWIRSLIRAKVALNLYGDSPWFKDEVKENFEAVSKKVRELIQLVDNGEEYFKKRIVAEFAKEYVTSVMHGLKPEINVCPFEFVDKRYFEENFPKVLRKMLKRKIRCLRRETSEEYYQIDWERECLERLEKELKKLEEKEVGSVSGC